MLGGKDFSCLIRGSDSLCSKRYVDARVGECRDLLNGEITLDTFVADIVNHIETEELSDVILVGRASIKAQ